MNRFIYHYSAFRQTYTGQIEHIDGIAQLEKRIICLDDYLSFKSKVDFPDGADFTVSSLSFLGMENDYRG